MTNKKCLTKADIAEALYLHLKIEKSQAIELVEQYIELIKKGLEEDGKVMLSGYGRYLVKEKKPRRGINPQTKEPLILRARRVVKFKPSQLLRDSINRRDPNIAENTVMSEAEEFG